MRSHDSRQAEPVAPAVTPEGTGSGSGSGGGASGTAARTHTGRHRQPPRSRDSTGTVLAAIATGGAIGAAACFEAVRLWPTPAGAFWTTLTVNAGGCLLIGVFLVTVTEVFTAHRLLRPFFKTGVLGGFTTFSTYCVDVEHLLDGRHATTALAYMAATVVMAMAAVGVGAFSTRRLLANRSES
ncbi:CrcB family protein [Streptomyces sp. NBC_00820]|uniref:fluoride efflux transporter FluC n=1 Tax=Streptomyces sp. NBC_00820 TaxID=2975842 RepID=UPI002ED59768|nr:CrcB family protein [Streptomyces sp. NBC_00820]